MKKFLLLLALLPALTGWSQDTVSNPYGRGYFTNNIPDTTSSAYSVGWVPTCGASCGVVAKEMKASQTLRIYGIEACMMSDRDALYLPESLSEEERQEWLDNFYSNFIDTSADELYEYLGIYLSDGDTALVPQREVMIQWGVDTPAYYVATGLYMWGGPNTTYPMYEKFFDSGYVAVSDYFYVGVTQRSCVGTFGTQAHMGLSLMRMSGRACEKSPEYHVKKMCWPEDGYVYWNWDPRVSMITYDHYLIFPILAPDDYPWDTSTGPCAVEFRAVPHRGLQRRRAEGLRSPGFGPRGSHRRRPLAPRYLPPPHHHPLRHGDKETAGAVKL